MKKYELVLNNNEEMVYDVDDLMEQEIVKFKEAIKGLDEADLLIFDNWVNVYKLLNYDIIDGLVINKVYKCNPTAALIELQFRGNVEYDFLKLNPSNMSVSCMNLRNNTVRNYIVRRLLVPQTAEEALMFTKSSLPEEAIVTLAKTIKEIETNGKKYEVKLSDKLCHSIDDNKNDKDKQPKVKMHDNTLKENKSIAETKVEVDEYAYLYEDVNKMIEEHIKARAITSRF